MPTVYFARYLLMPTGDLLHNGGITVEGNLITSIGSRGSLKRSSKDRIVNLGDMLLMPGMINAHTHLEESILRDFPKSDTETFAAWTAKTASRIKAAADTGMAASVRLAIREALANGITTIVDSARTDASVAVLAQEPIRSQVIFELQPETIDLEQTIIADLAARIHLSGRTADIGTGPHALFSMTPDSHAEVAQFAQRNHYLWAMHLAESAEELQAFTDQSGDLYFHITRKKSWPFGKTERGPMHHAISNNLIPDNALCFHCNYCDGEELALLAGKNVSVVICYQYGREIGHKEFPLDVAFRRGVNICLGTEGPGLSRPMNLFDELFQIKQAYPHFTAPELLSWVTRNPAKALGLGDKLGSLEEGKIADIIGLRAPETAADDILDEVMREEIEVAFVMVDGEEIIID
jgi:cytosine/adenosine deaminase-related metal-dependent hydrolase